MSQETSATTFLTLIQYTTLVAELGNYTICFEIINLKHWMLPVRILKGT